ncbi:unnamed protein product [Choristocarpus tenellus]
MHGLEATKSAAGRDGRVPVLPIVIAEEANWKTGWPLPPERARASGVLGVIPQPSHLQVSSSRLFSPEEGWKPIAKSAVAAISKSSLGGGGTMVVEVDAMSSGRPQSLLLPLYVDPEGDEGERKSVKEKIIAMLAMLRFACFYLASRSTSGTSPRTLRMDTIGGDRLPQGMLGMDQAMWGLMALREAWNGRVAVSILSGAMRPSVMKNERTRNYGSHVAGMGEEVVLIDARAAILSSVLTWAQQCKQDEEREIEARARAKAEVMAAKAKAAEARAAAAAASATAAAAAAGGGGGGVHAKQHRSSVPSGGGVGMREERNGDSQDVTAHVGSAEVWGGSGWLRGDGERNGIKGGEGVVTTRPDTQLLDAMGLVGQTLRKVLSPGWLLLGGVVRPIGSACDWLGSNWRKGVRDGGGNRTDEDKVLQKVLVYDTDDAGSFWYVKEQVRCLKGRLRN